ncbi:CDP-diacylglycerol--serine O-phosphatidyltransferase [Candidatus Woesearchaeota archaeon]|nr:MAG: CDP-diacylglycerol--serine O-phosphatidyltransferase [Candidatus Woesearchaeota archaeon]
MPSARISKSYSLGSLIGLADIITILNAVSGFFSIIFSFAGHFNYAFGMLVLAFVFDSVDGILARSRKTLTSSRKFGVQMDSLADVISFGLAPALIVYLMNPSSLSVLAGVLYLSSGMIRLARFNILPLRGIFVGFPIPTIVLVLPLFFLFRVSPAYYPWLLIALSALMNVPIAVPKPKIKIPKA